MILGRRPAAGRSHRRARSGAAGGLFGQAVVDHRHAFDRKGASAHLHASKEGPGIAPRPFRNKSRRLDLEVHVAAHAAARRHRRAFFRLLGDHGLVVTSRPATEAASCSAVRTTLTGSMMPDLDHVDIVALLGVEAEIGVLLVEHLAGDHSAVEAGVLGDLANRRLQRPAHDLDADLLVVVGRAQLVERADGVRAERRRRRQPRPSTAALVACMASSTRSFFSLTSTSVAPPTLMMATPPASLARRSWSFSRS